MRYKLSTIAEYSANGLANLADCANDNEQAADFLAGVRDAVVELTGEIAPEDWQRDAVENYAGALDQIADNAMSVYTFEKWQQFTGTRAWSEDLSEWVPNHTDMGKLADLALFIIANRLAVALVEEIAENMADTCADLGEIACGSEVCTCAS
jgi:hypothetical protein